MQRTRALSAELSSQSSMSMEGIVSPPMSQISLPSSSQTSSSLQSSVSVEGLVSPPLSQISMPSSQSFTDMLLQPAKRKKGKGRVKSLPPTIDESSDSEVSVVSTVPRSKKPRDAVVNPITDDVPVTVDARLEIMVGKCIAIQPNLEPLIARDEKTRKIFSGKYILYLIIYDNI